MTTTSVERPAAGTSPVPEPDRLLVTRDRKVLLKRLVACLFGGIVLALMIGPQEGTLTDFGVAFREAVLHPRIILFLGIGLIIFAGITLWPLLVPYLTRPGMAPLGAGLLIVVVAQTVMNWYDPLINSNGSGKFSPVSSVVSQTSALSGLTSAFFGYLAWTLLAVCVVGCLAAIVTRLRVLGFAVTVIGVVAAVLAYVAHHKLVSVGGSGIDHSLGVYADMIGFLTLAGAGLTVALSRADVARPREFITAVIAWRPGVILAVVGIVLGTLAFTTDGWFGTLQLNLTISATSHAFAGTSLGGLAKAYLSWLGYLLFGLAAAATVVAVYLRNQVAALVGSIVSLAGVVITFLTLDDITHLGARLASATAGTTWQNLGTGGYAACMTFVLFLGAGVAILGGGVRTRREAAEAATALPGTADLPPDTDTDGDETFTFRKLPMHQAAARVRASRNSRGLLVAAVGFALFYPPTLPITWQNVLVGQIGIYLLLAVGLNVVVGWAGLLDLGYIAFYEIGCYTTAYLTGSLPVKPPGWLQMTPLLTIPFAVVACLIAGVLLGGPTLRLRGDYLAIVTLGFGEIIQILAINLKSVTGGPIGPNIPHPVLKIGGFSVTWGEDNLPYWYLLLVMLVIVVALFYRLENSRIGRAWAAIREDEVAAQASGVNVTRIKVLAFAIGASTSALAGTFFASQVGYFDPSLFTLQASILIVAYVVFGGMGSLPGAMAGAAVLTWLPQFLKDQVPQDDRQMWIGALVLAMMIFRPAGLLPARRRKAELEGHLGGAPTAETQAVPASEGL